MKKITLLLLLVLSPIVAFSQTQTENYIKSTTYLSPFKGTIANYANYSQSIGITDLINTSSGGGSGSITISNNVLTVSFSGSWSPQTMKVGTIKALTVTPVLPKIELGPILASGIQTGYFAKIESNNLIFYSPFYLTGTSTKVSAPIAGGASGVNFTVSLSSIYSCSTSGGGGSSGSLAVNNGTAILNFSGGWSSTCNLKLGNIVQLPTAVTNTELGIIKDQNGLETTYRAKIENNWLVFYASQSIPVLSSAGSLNFTLNLGVTTQDRIENITYFDGLGRPKQQVSSAQSFSGKDIVTPIEYDAFGRQVKEYLPYVPTAAASLDYKTTALTEVGTFYNTAKYENTTNPFSQKEFEASPLNRVLKQAAPGNDWKLGNGHEIRLDYQANTNSDQVRRFGVSFIAGNTENPYMEDNGIYVPSQLYKTTTKDENWQLNQAYPDDHTTQEFKDKEGHVVLKRTFDAGKWHDTYYVYDNYGNLTYVLPPKVFTYNNLGQVFEKQEIFLDSYSDGATFFVNNIYYSEISMYESKGKLECYFSADNFQNEVLKSGKIADLNFSPDLPNMTLGDILMYNSIGDPIVAGTAYILNGDLYFSPTGDLVSSRGDFSTYFSINLDDWQTNFTIPALVRGTFNDLIYQYKYDKRNRLIEKKLPGKEWEYIVYDKIDRPILTQDANLKTTNKWLFIKYDVFNRPVYTGEYINNLKTTRNEIQLLADAGSNSEIKTAGNNFNGTTIYYSNFAFPNTSDINVLTINYYDNYNFDLNGGVSTTSYTITPITNAKGLATGNKVRILGTSNWITSVIYYDAKSRPIYNYCKNDYLATTSSVKSQFDFVGKTLETTSTHLRNSITTSIVDVFNYDQAGRLTKQTQAINGAATPEVIVANTYDELGQLSGKKVGGKTIQGLQKVDYAYNIRGWLKSINDPNNLNLDNDLFGFGLYYNTLVNPVITSSYQKPLYNGNISGTAWKITTNNTVLKQYDYTYDAMNRFKTAYYSENHSYKNSFNEVISEYDRNGNIMSLSRETPSPNIGNGSAVMDVLTYSYNNGNHLTKVDDRAKNATYGSEGFKDGSNTDDDYSYDANGNMTLDKNKGITAIVYNHLNLPVKITFGSGTIDYVYDATGVKQSKKVISTGTTITDYAGGFQYENNILKFFPQPEGFVAYNTGNFNYIYQYKDHLGNIRLSYSDSNNDGTIAGSEILEENNYYPFGLKHKNNNVVNSTDPALRYKYNGKELQDELGLGVYDYGTRNYDPALGRWMNIDPLAEQGRRWSPYTYAMDNPIYFIDPDGMWPENPFSGFISKARQVVTNYVVSKARELAGALVSKAVSTTGSVARKTLNSLTPNMPKMKSSSSSSNSSDSGFGIDFTVKNKDNAQEGMVKKDKGGRDVKQVEVDIIMDLTNVHGPEGSRGQTPLVPTEATSDSPNGGNTSSSTMETSTESDMVTVERVSSTATPVLGGGQAAESTINQKSKDTMVNRRDASKVKQMNNSDYEKAKRQQDANNRQN